MLIYNITKKLRLVMKIASIRASSEALVKSLIIHHPELEDLALKTSFVALAVLCLVASVGLPAGLIVASAVILSFSIATYLFIKYTKTKLKRGSVRIYQKVTPIKINPWYSKSKCPKNVIINDWNILNSLDNSEKNFNKPYKKFSRRKFPGLESSYTVDSKGGIFRHTHKRNSTNLEGPIGAGGVKTAYHMYDEKQKPSLVRGVVRGEFGTDKYMIKGRLMDSAKDLKGISNVITGVPVLQWSEKSGADKLVLYSPKMNVLFDYLDSHSFNTSIALEIMIKLTNGLYHIHKRGYAHRDLKLDNILIDDKLEPYIFDFDIAIKKTADFGEFCEMFSPHHIWENYPKTITELQKGDIFSLAIVFFQLAFGKNCAYYTRLDEHHILYKNGQITESEDKLKGMIVDLAAEPNPIGKVIGKMLSAKPPTLLNVVLMLKKIRRLQSKIF